MQACIGSTNPMMMSFQAHRSWPNYLVSQCFNQYHIESKQIYLKGGRGAVVYSKDTNKILAYLEFLQIRPITYSPQQRTNQKLSFQNSRAQSNQTLVLLQIKYKDSVISCPVSSELPRSTQITFRMPATIVGKTSRHQIIRLHHTNLSPLKQIVCSFLLLWRAEIGNL